MTQGSESHHSFPLLHRRGIDQLRGQVGRRRGVVIGVGRSASVRAHVERSLGVPPSIVRVGSDDIALLTGHTAADSPVLSIHLDESDDGVWRALDLSREALRRIPAVLLFWVSFDGLESFAQRAANLWALHGHVAWFVSRDDFEESGGIPSAQSVGVPMVSSSDFERRLFEANDLAMHTGPHQAWAALPKVDERRWAGLSATERQSWTQVAVRVACKLGYFEEARRYVERLPDDAMFPGRRDLEQSNVELQLGRHAEAEHALEAAIQRSTAMNPFLQFALADNEEGRLAPAAVNFAQVSINDLGSMSLTERWNSRAEHLLRRRAGSWWRRPASFVCEHRSAIARERLDLFEALREQHRAWRLRREQGARDHERQSVERLADLYDDLGLVADAAHFRELAAKAPKKTSVGEETEARIRAARLAVSAHARLEKGVEDIERALGSTAAEPSIEEALDLARRSWAEIEPPYRSLRLRARWFLAEAQWLESRGDAASAIERLTQLVNELPELPKTQCEARLALARLLRRAGRLAEGLVEAEAVRLRAFDGFAIRLEENAVEVIAELGAGAST